MARKRFLSRYDGKKLQWLHGVLFFILFLVIAALIMGIWLGASRVSGYSMYPTYDSGSLVFYTRHNSSLERGDIVAIRLASGEKYIKRIVGVPGDVIDIQNGILYINGSPETGDYINGTTEPEAGSVHYPYTVGEGRYFVLGDNREVSVDSRTFGAVSLAQIRGRILN